MNKRKVVVNITEDWPNLTRVDLRGMSKRRRDILSNSEMHWFLDFENPFYLLDILEPFAVHGENEKIELTINFDFGYDSRFMIYHNKDGGYFIEDDLSDCSVTINGDPANKRKAEMFMMRVDSTEDFEALKKLAKKSSFFSCILFSHLL